MDREKIENVIYGFVVSFSVSVIVMMLICLIFSLFMTGCSSSKTVYERQENEWRTVSNRSQMTNWKYLK